MNLRIPLERLPVDARERHARLRDYFCDRDAEAIRAERDWSLTLYWPSDPYRHVDLDLSDNLADWGCGLSDMPLAVRRQGRVTTALYDTWTLASWSRWATDAGIDADAPLTLLHIDDHRDLMSPRLFVDEGGLRDPIAGGRFRVQDPASVLRALESGAVGMGSFLTPFLHAFPKAEVRHLCQLPKADKTTSFRIETNYDADDLLEPGALRPAIALEPADGAGPGHYLQTPDLDDWLDGIGPGPILLHIDMDYFNNRFDGDGDWAERDERLDPPRSAIMARIGEVAAALRQRLLLPRIADAVVAYSPGFFPSDFWAEADQALRDSFGELYV